MTDSRFAYRYATAAFGAKAQVITRGPYTVTLDCKLHGYASEGPI